MDLSLDSITNSLKPLIPESVRSTAMIRLFGLAKVPLIFYCSPSIVEVNSQRCDVKIPLNWRTKNHWNSMYFGVLAVGADVAGGVIAMNLIEQTGKNVSLLFKDFKADFLKRPEGDVHFICEDGEAISKTVEETIATGQRVNTPMNIIATVPSISGDEPVAKFVLTLSLKYKP